MEEAGKQICQHLNSFQSLTNHSNHQVRRSLLHCVTRIVNNCSDTLESGLNHLITVIIALSVDEYESINTAASDLLNNLVNSLDEDSSFTVNQFIRNSLYELGKSMSSSLGLYQSERLERMLALVKGYLSFLLSSCSSSLFSLSPTHLNIMIENLFLLCKLDQDTKVAIISGDDKIGSDFSDMFNYSSQAARKQKSFCHLNTPRMVEHFNDICHLLGRHCCLLQLTIIMSEAITELRNIMDREVIYVFNRMVEGHSQPSSISDYQNFNKVLDLYLELLGQDNNAAMEETIEGVGIISRALGDKVDTAAVVSSLLLHSRQDLMDSLFSTLDNIAKGQDSDIDQILDESVEHVSKELNLNIMKLKNLSKSGIKLMIKVVVSRDGIKHDINDLQDTIEILLDHLANVDDKVTIDILHIVQVFVEAMKRKMSQEVNNNQVDEGAGDTKTEDPNKGMIARMIRELEKERRKDEDLAEELMNCPEDGLHDIHEDKADVEEETEQEDKKLTQEQKWLKEVIHHVRNFVSLQGKPEWQIVSINIINTCLHLLSHTPDQSEGGKQTVLLPLVHETWLPLKLCFKSSNLFLVEAAFNLVMTIARVARDFVHKRTVTDVFPALMNFIRSLQVMVGDRSKQNTMAATQSRRMLGSLSAGVWSLLELLDLDPLHTDQVISVVLEQLGSSLLVTNTDSGPLRVTGPGLGARLRVEEDQGETKTLEPIRNVDKNILWLKLNHGK